VAAVLSQLSGVERLMASRLCGSGLRLLECVTLRVKDVDFAVGQLIVRERQRFQGSRDSAAADRVGVVEEMVLFSGGDTARLAPIRVVPVCTDV